MTTNLSLYDALAGLVAAGDEAGAKKFIIDNFQNLPEEAKENAILMFLEEGIDTEIAEEEAIRNFQKEALETLDALEKEQKLAMDGEKLSEVRSQLDAMM